MKFRNTFTSYAHFIGGAISHRFAASFAGAALAVATLVSPTAAAAQVQEQILKPGFDKSEYIECLCMASNMDSLRVEEKYLCQKPQTFTKVYAAKSTGFDNQWELWRRTDGVMAIMMRATVTTMTSWGSNFNAGMVKAVGAAQIGDREISYDFCADSTAFVHSGWTAGLLTMADDIKVKLDSCYKAGCRNFFIAGHSQGGGLSFLVTAMLRRMQQKGLIAKDIIFKTYASAAPKVGDYTFALWYEAMTQGGWAYNVVNPEDWVPEVPLSIQRIDDFRPTNPFTHKDELLANASAGQKIKIKFLFNKLQKPTQQAVDNCRKYLGETLGKMLADQHPWFKTPVYENCNNFVRVGPTFVLMPDEEYYAKHPHVATDPFEHHQYVSYYDLAIKLP